MEQDLKTKTGQRLVINFEGTALTPELARLVVECRVGGVILFGSNLESLEQVRRLNLDLQRLAAENNLPPLIISLDEEGGRVSRMPFDGVEYTAPSQMAQAAAGGETALNCARSTARRLRRLGFNLDFAPVADVNNNPDNPVIGTRSFSSDPALVAQLAARAIKAYLEEGIAPCAKHFPGHGDTAVDSHLGLPSVDKSLEQLNSLELRPFREAVQAGVPAIMTAHIIFPRLEPQLLPATLSPFFLGEKGLLRREMAYQGLVFTDALAMRAIADTYGMEEACLLSLQAGADIVMPVGSYEAIRACFEAMLEASKLGEFEIEESAARIATFKARFCLPPLPLKGMEAELPVIREAARQSLTLLRNNQKVLPLSPGRYQRPLLVEVKQQPMTLVEERKEESLPSLTKLLEPGLPGLRTRVLFPEFSPGEAGALQEAAAESDLLIFICRNSARNEPVAALIAGLLKTGLPSVVVAARDPYDLGAFEADALIATYAEPACTTRALAAFLLGGFPPRGKLPVEISGRAERGSGLVEF